LSEEGQTVGGVYRRSRDESEKLEEAGRSEGNRKAMGERKEGYVEKKGQ
jgi:hypothetical protein